LIWLAPAALSSIIIALILKVNERRGGDRILIAGANYLVASAISFMLLASNAGGFAAASGGPGWHVALPGVATLALGGVAGIIYVLGFLLLMAGIARLPLAVPVTVARLSVVLPVAVSIFLWHESPGSFQWLGIALGLAAIILFGMSFSSSGHVSRAGGRSSLLIASLLMVLGLGDVLLKAFREMASDVDRLAFTFVLFTVAAIFTWLLVLMRRIRFDARTFGLGLLLGVPNLFSTVFTLLALRSVPASIAFPFINLTVIVGTTILGFAIWKERLSKLNLAGLGISFCAIVMLSW
jgi:drug/metabolite transporter (DMT)-like permease